MKLNVYLSQYSPHKASDLHKLSHDKLISDTLLTPAKFSYAKEGYTLVGTAEAQITLFSPTECAAQQVATLRAEVQQTRADAQQKVTALERKINSLLALEDCTSEAQP